MTPDQQDDGSQKVGSGRIKSGSHRYSEDPEFLDMEVDSSSIRKVQEEVDDSDELDLVIRNMVSRAKGVTQEQRELLMAVSDEVHKCFQTYTWKLETRQSESSEIEFEAGCSSKESKSPWIYS